MISKPFHPLTLHSVLLLGVALFPVAALTQPAATDDCDTSTDTSYVCVDDTEPATIEASNVFTAAEVDYAGLILGQGTADPRTLTNNTAIIRNAASPNPVNKAAIGIFDSFAFLFTNAAAGLLNMQDPGNPAAPSVLMNNVGGRLENFGFIVSLATAIELNDFSAVTVFNSSGDGGNTPTISGASFGLSATGGDAASTLFVDNAGILRAIGGNQQGIGVGLFGQMFSATIVNRADGEISGPRHAVSTLEAGAPTSTFSGDILLNNDGAISSDNGVPLFLSTTSADSITVTNSGSVRSSANVAIGGFSAVSGGVFQAGSTSITNNANGSMGVLQGLLVDSFSVTNDGQVSNILISDAVTSGPDALSTALITNNDGGTINGSLDGASSNLMAYAIFADSISTVSVANDGTIGASAGIDDGLNFKDVESVFVTNGATGEILGAEYGLSQSGSTESLTLFNTGLIRGETSAIFSSDVETLSVINSGELLSTQMMTAPMQGMEEALFALDLSGDVVLLTNQGQGRIETVTDTGQFLNGAKITGNLIQLSNAADATIGGSLMTLRLLDNAPGDPEPLRAINAVNSGEVAKLGFYRDQNGPANFGSAVFSNLSTGVVSTVVGGAATNIAGDLVDFQGLTSARLNNAGTITATADSAVLFDTITAAFVDNTFGSPNGGSIQGSAAGVFAVDVDAFTLSANSGTIAATADDGIGVDLIGNGDDATATVNNSINGLIIGGGLDGVGLLVEDFEVAIINNSGTISAGTSGAGVGVENFYVPADMATTTALGLTNSGSVIAGGVGLFVAGIDLVTVDSSGLLQGGTGAAVDVDDVVLLNFTNSGTVLSSDSGEGLDVTVDQLILSNTENGSIGTSSVVLDSAQMTTEDSNLSNAGRINRLSVSSTNNAGVLFTNTATGVLGFSATRDPLEIFAAQFTDLAVLDIDNAGSVSAFAEQGLRVVGSDDVEIMNASGGAISAVARGLSLLNSSGTLTNEGLIEVAENIEAMIDSGLSRAVVVEGATSTFDVLNTGSGVISGHNTGIDASGLAGFVLQQSGSALITSEAGVGVYADGIADIAMTLSSGTVSGGTQGIWVDSSSVYAIENTAAISGGTQGVQITSSGSTSRQFINRSGGSISGGAVGVWSQDNDVFSARNSGLIEGDQVGLRVSGNMQTASVVNFGGVLRSNALEEDPMTMETGLALHSTDGIALTFRNEAGGQVIGNLLAGSGTSDNLQLRTGTLSSADDSPMTIRGFDSISLTSGAEFLDDTIITMPGLAQSVIQSGNAVIAQSLEVVNGGYVLQSGQVLNLRVNDANPFTVGSQTFTGKPYLRADTVNLGANARIQLLVSDDDYTLVDEERRYALIRSGATITGLTDNTVIIESVLLDIKEVHRDVATALDVTLVPVTVDRLVSQGANRAQAVTAIAARGALFGNSQVADDDPIKNNMQAADRAGPQVFFAFLDTLMPSISGEVNRSAATVLRNSNRNIARRSNALRGRSSGSRILRNGLWLQGYGSDFDQGDNRDGRGYEGDTQGFSLGYDVTTRRGTVLGVAVSSGNTDIDSRVANNTLETESVFAAFYMAMPMRRWTLDATLTAGTHSTDSTRFVSGTRNEADIDSTQFGLDLRLGQSTRVRRFTSRFAVGFSYSRLDVDAYREKGSSAALAVDSQQYDEPLFYLGGGFEYNLRLQRGMVLRPSLQFDLYADLQQDGIETINRFVVGGPSFKLVGSEPDDITGVASLGLALLSGDRFSVEVALRHTGSDSFEADSYFAKLRWEF